jgi:exodeoxyribonuclease VII small subunit
MSDDEALTFEQAFHQLQQTVEQLEDGALPLDEALTLFERGMQLAALCASHLDQAALRVLEIETALTRAMSNEQ